MLEYPKVQELIFSWPGGIKKSMSFNKKNESRACQPARKNTFPSWKSFSPSVHPLSLFLIDQKRSV